MANVISLLTSLCDNFKNSALTSNPGTLPSQTVTNPRQQINAYHHKEATTGIEPNRRRQRKKCAKSKFGKYSTHVPSPGEEDSIFIEVPKPKAKKTVNLDPNPNSYQSKLPYPERMKVRENDEPRTKRSLRRSLSRPVNAECSAIIMNKVPEKLEDRGKFLIPCALQELNRTKIELEALTPTRMTLELANRSITHPMGIAEDVVVRVDGFTFLADFVVVNFEPDPRVPIILGRPFLRIAKALIDLYEEKLTLRVGKGELVYYADKYKKNKEKNCVHAISIIDFS
ncbi:reverse transcriptase domain-containing protein, partial [Tanacetum coccineum]